MSELKLTEGEILRLVRYWISEAENLRYSSHCLCEDTGVNSEEVIARLVGARDKIDRAIFYCRMLGARDEHS